MAAIVPLLLLPPISTKTIIESIAITCPHRINACGHCSHISLNKRGYQRGYIVKADLCLSVVVSHTNRGMECIT